MIFFKSILKNSALIVIFIYQRVFSPTLGILRHIPFYPKPSCIFYPTCSEYAKICFKKYTFLKALRLSLNRVGRCHPFNEPGIDHP